MKVVLEAVRENIFEATGTRDRTVAFVMNLDTCAEATTTLQVEVSVDYDSAEDQEGLNTTGRYLVKVPPVGFGRRVEVEVLEDTEPEGT